MERETITGVLGEYEENGYHDSDFYAIHWDGADVKRTMIDTTRGCMGRPVLVKATDAELLAAREWAVAGKLVEGPKYRDTLRIMEPGTAERGDRLRLLVAVTFKDGRCGIPVKATAGEVGTVIWTGNFGTFHRNGYNKRGRSNLRIGLRFDDGRVVFCGMVKLRLDSELLSDAEYAERAENASWTGAFANLSSAWMSWNHAAERLPVLRAFGCKGICPVIGCKTLLDIDGQTASCSSCGHLETAQGR